MSKRGFIRKSSIKDIPSVMSFEVYLVNKYRQRKKRNIVVDTVQGTLSRSNRKNRHKTEAQDSTDDGDDLDLRKTVEITPTFSLLPSESDNRKLRLLIREDVRPLEIIFKSAAIREQFSSMVRVLRSMATPTQAEEKRISKSAEVHAPTRLDIFCTTFNVSKQSPPTVQGDASETSSSVDSDSGAKKQQIFDKDDLYNWIPPDEFDLYFIGLQECRSKTFADWQQLFVDGINRKFDKGSRKGSQPYKVLTSISMWGIHGLIVVREHLVKHFTHVHTDYRACGLGGVMGNKGAVGISLQYGDGTTGSSTTFAFVNSHLAARCERLVQRSEDYAEICRTLLSRKKGHFKDIQLLHGYDHVFWIGDLNYRIDMGKHGTLDEFQNICEIIRKDQIKQLSPHDQLARERATHNVFVGFREGSLNFPPTYRMEFGHIGLYNNNKNQSPSWTDRVLWRSQPGSIAKVEQSSYHCADHIFYSDHRPVCAFFSVLTANRSQIMPAQSKRNLLGNGPLRGAVNMTRSTVSKVTSNLAKFQDNDQLYFKIKKVQFLCTLENPDQMLQQQEQDANWNKTKRRSNTVCAADDEIYSDGEEDEEDLASLPTVGSFRQVPRKNSYRRPLQLDESFFDEKSINNLPSPRKSTPFVGKGFGGGPGELDMNENCSQETSEFVRYVSQADSGVSTNSKLWLRFHASFLEDSPNSTAVMSSKKYQPTHFKYHWNDSNLPVIKPFISDSIYLAGHQLVVTIHKPVVSSKHGQIVGHAHISLKDIATSGKAWFAVPVLFNGQPAGILKGQLENDFAAESVERAKMLERKASMHIQRSEPFTSYAQFASDESDEESSEYADSEDEDIQVVERVSFSCITKEEEKVDAFDETEELHAEDTEHEEEEEEEEDKSIEATKESMSGSNANPDFVEDASAVSPSGKPSDLPKNSVATISTQEEQPGEQQTQEEQPGEQQRPLSSKKRVSKMFSGALRRNTSAPKAPASPKRAASYRTFSSAPKQAQTSDDTICEDTATKAKTLTKQISSGGESQHSVENGVDNGRKGRVKSGWFSKMGFTSSKSSSETAIFSYAELVGNRYNLGLNQAKLEQYLSDDEFEQVFHLSKSKFAKLPKWKRIMKKKEVKLF